MEDRHRSRQRRPAAAEAAMTLEESTTNTNDYYFYNICSDDGLLPRQSLARRRHRQNKVTRNPCLVVALVALVLSWGVCFVLLLEYMTTETTTISSSLITSSNRNEKARTVPLSQTVLAGGAKMEMAASNENGDAAVSPAAAAATATASIRRPPNQHLAAAGPRLLSRKPNDVVATSDVRGNLGPASVLLQAHPGTDWIHDRWQAASDMHGSQIPGAHWIQLEFRDGPVLPTTVVLDWETAYADEYVLEASSSAFPKDFSAPPPPDTQILFDGRDPDSVREMRTVAQSGRSPGVKEARPLHVVHTLKLDESSSGSGSGGSGSGHLPAKYLRLRILKSVTGWGVSLWQFDVHGYRGDDLQTAR